MNIADIVGWLQPHGIIALTDADELVAANPELHAEIASYGYRNLPPEEYALVCLKKATCNLEEFDWQPSDLAQNVFKFVAELKYQAKARYGFPYRILVPLQASGRR
jgi:hypothetical protein